MKALRVSVLLVVFTAMGTFASGQVVLPYAQEDPGFKVFDVARQSHTVAHEDVPALWHDLTETILSGEVVEEDPDHIRREKTEQGEDLLLLVQNGMDWDLLIGTLDLKKETATLSIHIWTFAGFLQK